MPATGQAVTGDQFYVTHCGTTDSVLGAPGYSVRAASVPADDHDALRLALKYPPYELPLEMWKELPARVHAPRRLARTKHPAGGVWVAHAVYLEKDTMDRDRSYFSHLLHLPAADPAAVLRSWDSPGWTKDYSRGADKTLPRGRLPVGTAISDDTLAAFLSADSHNGSTELSVAVCPARLRACTATRRELAARFLQALVLTRETRGRERLFVHAEPGLVAMLLYAAVRLLPPAWMANLTFSTFEPYHRGIQDYKLASVVGTYLGVPGKGLDTDLVSARGFGLDTVVPDRSSRELSVPPLPGVKELIDLAAAGEWSLLADVHRRIGAEAGAMARVQSAAALVRGVRKKTQLEKVLKKLDERLPELSASARERLRVACAECDMWPPHHLLAPVSLDEFDALLSESTPAEWKGYACVAVLGPDARNWLAAAAMPIRDALRIHAREFLFGASPGILTAYIHAARPHFDSEPVLLLGLFQPYVPACRTLMDRLLRTTALEPADWVKLIQSLNLYAGDWDGFLLEGDRLTRLLVALGGNGIGREVWKGYLDELSPALLSPVLAAPDTDGPTVHAWERTVHAHLSHAAEELRTAGVKLVHALPPGGVARLFAANDLVRWMEDPGSVDQAEVARACQSFGVAPHDFARVASVDRGAGTAESLEPTTSDAEDSAFAFAQPTNSREESSGSVRRETNGSVWVVAVVVALFFAAVAGAIVLLKVLGEGQPNEAELPSAGAH